MTSAPTETEPQRPGKPRATRAQPPAPELLSIPAAAVVLNCGQSLVWAMVRDGKLTRISLGTRTTRVRVDEVQAVSRGER